MYTALCWVGVLAKARKVWVRFVVIFRARIHWGSKRLMNHLWETFPSHFNSVLFLIEPLTSTLTFPLLQHSPSFPRAAAVLPILPGPAQLPSFLPDLLKPFQVEWFTACPRLHLVYSHLQFSLSCLLLWEVPVPVIGAWVPIGKE